MNHAHHVSLLSQHLKYERKKTYWYNDLMVSIHSMSTLTCGAGWEQTSQYALKEHCLHLFLYFIGDYYAIGIQVVNDWQKDRGRTWLFSRHLLVSRQITISIACT